MRVKGAIIGSARLIKALQKVQDDYEEVAKSQLKKAALTVHREAIKSIREISAGEAEVRYKPTRVVRVSKPGDAPNNDSGTLIKNIGWNIDEERVVAEIGTGLEYGKHLEYGTQDMKARPWLKPALERVKSDLIQIFRGGRKKKDAG